MFVSTYNKIDIIDAQTARMVLSKGFSCLISLKSISVLQRYKWFADTSENRTSAVATINCTPVLMSRFLLNASNNMMVDHANGDSLDNRLKNLRLATSSQNGANSTIHRINNTSGYKGVVYNKRKLK